MCSQSETGIFVSSIHCPHPPLNHQIGHAKLLKKSNHNDMTHHTPKEMTPEPLEIIRGALLQEFVGPELYGGVGGHPYDVDERTAIKSLHAVSCVCLPHTVPANQQNRQDFLEGGGGGGGGGWGLNNILIDSIIFTCRRYHLSVGGELLLTNTPRNARWYPCSPAIGGIS